MLIAHTHHSSGEKVLVLFRGLGEEKSTIHAFSCREAKVNVGIPNCWEVFFPMYCGSHLLHTAHPSLSWRWCLPGGPRPCSSPSPSSSPGGTSLPLAALCTSAHCGPVTTDNRITTVDPPIRDPQRYRDYLSTRDKIVGPIVSLVQRFHCIYSKWASGSMVLDKGKDEQFEWKIRMVGAR